MDQGAGYATGYTYTNILLQILKKAVDIVGTANVDGQAIHNVAIDFEIQYEG